MDIAISPNPACRLELPTFYFVDVYKPHPTIKRRQVLSNFTVGDLENKVTAKTITEALQKTDTHLIK